MPLREVLQAILTDFSAAKAAPLKGNAFAGFIRDDATQPVQEALGELGAGLIVEGSPGQGNWAEVPWISVFDPAITTSATRGYYVVYLFHATEPVVHLSLNQGTTATRKEFGDRARKILADRANLMRKRVAEYEELLPITNIELGSTARLPGDYVAGHAMGASYTLSALPEEAKLRGDLQAIVRAYRSLTFRGGVDADVDLHSDTGEEFNLPTSTSVVEIRKYVFHRKIERNRTAARQAKKFHGTICQACNIEFAKTYGAIGNGFIEAHHLKPISTLQEGIAVHYDIAQDFAVLCSNCHRMIHRSPDPANLTAFRALVQSNKI